MGADRYQFVRKAMNQTLSTPQHHLTSAEERLLSAVERLITLNEVEYLTGFKSSFIYQLIKLGRFPRPVKIGNASRWRESEVQQWIQEQIAGGSSGNSAG